MEQKLLEEIQKLSSQVCGMQKQLTELLEFKREFQEAQIDLSLKDWFTRKRLMEILDYGDTQMASFLKNKDLAVSEIGKRKFIKKESVIKLLEKNIKK